MANRYELDDLEKYGWHQESYELLLQEYNDLSSRYDDRCMQIKELEKENQKLQAELVANEYYYSSSQEKYAGL